MPTLCLAAAPPPPPPTGCSGMAWLRRHTQQPTGRHGWTTHYTKDAPMLVLGGGAAACTCCAVVVRNKHVRRQLLAPHLRADRCPIRRARHKVKPLCAEANQPGTHREWTVGQGRAPALCRGVYCGRDGGRHEWRAGPSLATPIGCMGSKSAATHLLLAPPQLAHGRQPSIELPGAMPPDGCVVRLLDKRLERLKVRHHHIPVLRRQQS